MSRGKSPIIAVEFLLLVYSVQTFGAATNLFVVEDPQTGNSEAVWSSQAAGQNTAQVLYSYLDGSSWAPSVTLSTLGRPGLTPALAIDGTGSRRAVFATAEATDRVLMRTLASSGGNWGPEVQVSDPTQPSTRPWVVVHSGQAYVSYEVLPSGSARVVTVAKIDPEGHVERTLVASTSSTSALDTRIYSEDGHLWVDWVADSATLGFSEWLGESWGAPQYQSYETGWSANDARNHVRSMILGF